MKKQFKPLIKHDEVTQTYTIRDKHGVVIQVPDVIIDELDNYYKAERIKLEVENEKLKQQLKETREFFVDIKVENEELKRKLKECSGE